MLFSLPNMSLKGLPHHLQAIHGSFKIKGFVLPLKKEKKKKKGFCCALHLVSSFNHPSSLYCSLNYHVDFFNLVVNMPWKFAYMLNQSYIQFQRFVEFNIDE